jgi:Ser/Thr protein kinase RdoA (MazF antagonist)
VNDAAVVGRILREYHLRGLRPSGVTRVHGTVSGGTVAYQVAPDDEPPFVVRAFRADAPVPTQFSGSAAETMVDWVMGRARTLGWLEAVGYPAPRVVRPRSGELVGVAGQWLTWATTFVDGPVLRPTLEQLRMLGEALGRLHSLDGAGSGAGAGGTPAVAPGRAAWHPAAAVATTLARLQSVAAMIPLGWRDMHDAFLETSQTVQSDCRLVPEALVHGDAWPGNAVQTGAAEVTLIDWETAGLGLPVLDLGHCLAECHLDSDLPPDRPEAWLVQPDEHRIAAVASGYSAVRPVPAAERELLGAGVRFGAAFVGAIHFEAALTRGASGPSMDARLERLRNRVAVSDEVARLALRHLAPAT